MSALHCLTNPLLHSCIEPISFVLVDWFGASFFHRFDPVIHRFSFIEHSFGFMFAFVNWFIGSPATCHGISNESMFHCSTDSDSLIRCCTIDRPMAMGHRATGPPGHQATRPQGHQPPATGHQPSATKSFKFVGESAGIRALRRLPCQIRTPSWLSHCWGILLYKCINSRPIDRLDH